MPSSGHALGAGGGDRDLPGGQSRKPGPRSRRPCLQHGQRLWSSLAGSPGPEARGLHAIGYPRYERQKRLCELWQNSSRPGPRGGSLVERKTARAKALVWAPSPASPYCGGATLFPPGPISHSIWGNRPASHRGTPNEAPGGVGCGGEAGAPSCHVPAGPCSWTCTAPHRGRGAGLPWQRAMAKGHVRHPAQCHRRSREVSADK